MLVRLPIIKYYAKNNIKLIISNLKNDTYHILIHIENLFLILEKLIKHKKEVRDKT